MNFKIGLLALAIFFSFISINVFAQKTNVQDSLELVKFYNSTNGSNWNNKNGWLSGPVRVWHGIGLNDSGKVVAIRLGDNNLSGILSNLSQLNLSDLKELSLYKNNLTGNVPNFILPSLHLLDLSQNELTGTIPDFNLPSLKILSLSFTKVTGNIPNFNLPNLQELWLAVSNLTGTIPNLDLPSLKVLDLSWNRLTGSIPNFNIQTLEVLRLRVNQLNGRIPTFNLSNLRIMDLSYNKLTDSIPNFNLPNLEELRLNTNRLSGTIPKFNLLKLTALTLESNKFTFNGLEYIVKKYPFTTYAPQDTILHLTKIDSVFSVAAGGTKSNNTYKWFNKLGVLERTNTNDSTFVTTNNMGYYVEVNNTIATQLTLRSDTSSTFLVINPNPSLITDDDLLDTDISRLDYSKTVKSAATDGVTKLLLICDSKDPITFSIEGDKNGTLSNLPDQIPRSEPITIEPDANGKVIAVYTVPDGYGTSANIKGGRYVTIKTVNENDVTDVSSIQLKLVTPPVVLVHGMWSDPNVWKTGGFANSLDSIGLTYEMADYALASHMTFDPERPGLGIFSVHEATSKVLKKYRELGIACTQVDVVAHSLGGLMTRSYTQQDYYNTERNYKQGYVHKLITLGTPHLGSPLGPLLFEAQDRIALLNIDLSGFGITYSFLANWAKQPIGTCHEDFNPKESNGLANLKETKVKAHAITGTYGLNAAIDVLALGKLLKIVSPNPLISGLPGAVIHANVFDFKPNDVIVKVESQEGKLGIGPTAPISPFTNVTHSTITHSTISFSETETNSKAIRKRVKELLLSNDATLFSPYFPAPGVKSRGDRNGGRRLEVLAQDDKHHTQDGTKRNARITRTSATSKERVSIVSPARGAVYNHEANTKITLKYNTIEGALPVASIFMIEGIGIIEVPNKAPYDVTINMPREMPVGRVNVALLVRDTTGVLLADTTHILIKTSSPINRISVSPNNLVLDSLIRELPINISGTFFNGQDTVYTNLSSTTTGTTFNTQKGNTIVKVADNGLVAAVSPGADTIEINHGGKSFTVQVTVLQNFDQAVKSKNIIDFPLINDITINDLPFALSASATADQQVTFTLISGPAELQNGILTATGTGQITVKASQEGNVYYDKAQDVIRTFCVKPFAAITASGNNLTSSATSGNQWYLNGAAIPGATAQKYIATASGTYKVEVTENGCKASSTDLQLTVTGIVDVDAWEGEVKIFPNPVREQLKIENQKSRSLSINILDGLGKVVLEKTYSAKLINIDMTPFAVGNYIVVVTDLNKNESISRKIIKLK